MRSARSATSSPRIEPGRKPRAPAWGAAGGQVCPAVMNKVKAKGEAVPLTVRFPEGALQTTVRVPFLRDSAARNRSMKIQRNGRGSSGEA